MGSLPYCLNRTTDRPGEKRPLLPGGQEKSGVKTSQVVACIYAEKHYNSEVDPCIAVRHIPSIAELVQMGREARSARPSFLLHSLTFSLGACLPRSSCPSLKKGP